jgi:hypothetical protein
MLFTSSFIHVHNIHTKAIQFFTSQEVKPGRITFLYCAKIFRLCRELREENRKNLTQGKKEFKTRFYLLSFPFEVLNLNYRFYLTLLAVSIQVLFCNT